MPESASRSDTAPTGVAAQLSPLFISIADGTRMLGVSLRTMRDLIDSDAIETRYVGRRRLVVYESLRRYAEGLPSTPGG